MQVEAEEWLDRICVFGDVDDSHARLEALRVSANVDVFTPVARDCVARTLAAGWCEYMRSNRVNLAHIGHCICVPFSAHLDMPWATAATQEAPRESRGGSMEHF